MPKKVLKPRRRLIGFRLSDDEFEALQSAYACAKARNMTDFMRSVVLRTENMPEGSQQTLQRQILNLGHKVSALESRIAKALNLLEGAG